MKYMKYALATLFVLFLATGAYGQDLHEVIKTGTLTLTNKATAAAGGKIDSTYETAGAYSGLIDLRDVVPNPGRLLTSNTIALTETQAHAIVVAKTQSDAHAIVRAIAEAHTATGQVADTTGCGVSIDTTSAESNAWDYVALEGILTLLAFEALDDTTIHTHTWTETEVDTVTVTATETIIDTVTITATETQTPVLRSTFSLTVVVQPDTSGYAALADSTRAFVVELAPVSTSSVFGKNSDDPAVGTYIGSKGGTISGWTNKDVLFEEFDLYPITRWARIRVRSTSADTTAGTGFLEKFDVNYVILGTKNQVGEK